MEMIYKVFYAVHIFSGFLSLLTGFLANISKKGSKFHIKAGRIYYYSMVSVFITALVTSVYKANTFLLMIAIFSMYFAFVGVRVLKFKNKEYKAAKLEFSVVFGMLLVSFIMIVLSFYINGLSIILFIFGIVGLVSPLQYIYGYRRDPNFLQKKWLVEHIGNIGGAYIATVTAFFVVNVPKYFPDFPMVLIWILPGFLGAFIIRIASNKYQKKLIVKNA
jgi:hypothetical protein